MAHSDDLKSHAASSHDFYELLDISPASADTEIRRAYRRTALKYHPDKLSNPTQVDLDKFHLLQIAYDVLSEPSVRQLYDNAREARERKKKENEMLEGVRRKMKDDLEARERGVKRPWGPAEPAAAVDREAEDKLEREIKRLAEEGKRKRREKEELMKREVLEEEERREREEEEKERAEQNGNQDAKGHSAGGTLVTEIDRTVKVRWVREGSGVEIDSALLESLFSAFGNVESVFTLKDKRQRVGEQREKITIATGVVVFSSVVGAHAAVEDSKNQQGREWDVIRSVYWASNKEPDWDSHRRSPAPAAAHDRDRKDSSTAATSNSQPPKTSRNLGSFPGLGTQHSSLDKRSETKKTPSFASFGNGLSTGASSNVGTNSPSLEEITLIRLKNAERKKLKEQIQKEDEAALSGEKVQ